MRLRIAIFFLLNCVAALAIQQSFDEIRQKALAGDAKAQNDLGVMYRQGDGVQRDKAEAVKWYRKAAFQKYPDAIYNLGIAYFNGDGVVSNELKAYGFLSIARDEGSSEASTALDQFSQGWPESKINAAKKVEAEIYSQGSDVPENSARAYKLNREVAEAGDPYAQYTTCLLLNGGRGVEKNAEAAFEWCMKSAKQGDPMAMMTIAEKYEHGIGTPVDYKKAERWYRLVAYERLNAAINIAHLYKNGLLKSKDPLWAEAYLSYGARGDKSAKAELDSDIAKMDESKKQRLEELTKKLSDELYKMKHTKP